MILNFFHLPYYLLSNYYRNDVVSPQYGALPALTIVLSAQELFLYTLIRAIQDPYAYGAGFSKSSLPLILIINLTFVYFIYVRGDKLMKVYYHYKDKLWANTKAARIAGWVYVLLSIVSPFLLVIVKNAAIGRHLI